MTDEPKNEDVAKAARRGADADHDALLARYGLQDLPVVFAMPGPDGKVIQEKLACYQCMADGFYGKGVTGTYYQESDIIVADIIPNEFMQPLNRAAGLRYANWMSTLPQNKAPIAIEDMAEAAQMLAKDPRVTDLPPDDYQRAVTELAAKLKIRRGGKDALDLPLMSAHNFAPVSGGKAPPILNAKLSDMAARGPGFSNSGPANATAPGGTRRITATPAPIGGTPQR